MAAIVTVTGAPRLERKDTKLLQHHGHGHGHDERVAMTTTDDTTIYDVIDDSRWRVKCAMKTTPAEHDIWAQIRALEANMNNQPHAPTPSTLPPSSAASAYTFTTLPPSDDDTDMMSDSKRMSSSSVTTRLTVPHFPSLDEETSLLDAFSVLSLTDDENKLLDARIFEASLTIPRMVFDSLLREVAQDYMAEFRKKKYPITDAEHNELQRLFNDRRGQLVIDAFSIEMTTTLLQCLKPGQWLNDEVINFYFSLLDERNKRHIAEKKTTRKMHFFNSFFYTKLSENNYNYKNVSRWSKKAKIVITSMDYVFAPIHVGHNHWCLAVINFVDKRFEYYDSMHGNNARCIQNLRAYVNDESKTYNSKPFDFTGWTDYVPKDIPAQNNGCDCGVFTSKFADFMSDGRTVYEFEQRDMPYFRRRMALEIKYKRVL